MHEFWKTRQRNGEVEEAIKSAEYKSTSFHVDAEIEFAKDKDECGLFHFDPDAAAVSAVAAVAAKIKEFFLGLVMAIYFFTARKGSASQNPKAIANALSSSLRCFNVNGVSSGEVCTAASIFSGMRNGVIDRLGKRVLGDVCTAMLHRRRPVSRLQTSHRDMGESATKSLGKGERGDGSGSATISFSEQLGDLTLPDGGDFAEHNPIKMSCKSMVGDLSL